MRSVRAAAAVAMSVSLLTTACGGGTEASSPPSATTEKGPDPAPTKLSGTVAPPHDSRVRVSAAGLGPIRLGASVAALKDLGARFSEGGAIGNGHCLSFALPWAGNKVHGQVHDRDGVQLIHLDDWGETSEGIATGDSLTQAAAAYRDDYVTPEMPLLVPVSGDGMWAILFDRSRRPITVGAVALMDRNQGCVIL